MTYLVSPEMKLKLGEREYTLSPSVECLKKIQHHFKKDIIDVLQACPQMRFDEHAKLIEIAIDDYGDKPPAITEIEQWIVDEIGIAAVRNLVQGWLLVVTAPKTEREVVAATVGEFLKSQGM